MVKVLEEVDAAVFAEGGDGFSGGGIELVEVVAGGKDDAAEAFGLPVDEATVDAHVTLIGFEGVESPEFAAGGCIEGEDLELRGGAVEDSVDDEGVALDLGASVGAAVTGVVGPGDLELVGVLAVDLAE